MLPGWKLEEILPTLAQKAGEWISEQSKSSQPFFLYPPLTSPHAPIAPSDKFLGKSGISAYADFVIETDWVVGHVMASLEESGVAGNTIVIFSTDNGTSPKANFAKLENHGVDLRNHYKGHKAQIHEGGHRVPFVIRWPGKVKQGSVCHETICLNDFMATVADISDFKLPADCAENSTSLLPLITGKQTSLPHRPLVVNHDIAGNFAIRKGKWKLVGNSKLFDLMMDPKESTDLSAAYPEIVKDLYETLRRYRSGGL